VAKNGGDRGGRRKVVVPVFLQKLLYFLEISTTSGDRPTESVGVSVSQ
jgi:hypothetical protein